MNTSTIAAADPIALAAQGIELDRAGQYDAAISALRRAVPLLQDRPDVASPFFDACRYLIHSLVGMRRYDEAEAALAGLKRPTTDEARYRLAALHCGLAADLTFFNEVRRAIAQYRAALAVWPEIGARVNLMTLLAATGERAILADFTTAIASAQVQQFLLIACMPKSGSSFLKSALCTLTGFPETELAYAYVQNEQELDLPRVIAAAQQPSVTQQHCRATEANIQIMQGFGIRPVVLVRNLFDIVASLVDFYDSGAVSNTFFGPFWPTLSPRERVDLIVDHILPWYFAFYASWINAERARRLDLLWMSYEEMVADKVAALSKVAGFYGMTASPERIAAAVVQAEGNRVASRFNKGVAGRGSSLLDTEQKARVAVLASRYRGIDFGRLGL